MNRKVITYIQSILLPVVIGGVVGLIIAPFMDYNSLVQPFLAPPSFLFPIVWTILYIFMGVSYGILKNNQFSFLWILLLDVLVIMMIGRFYSKNKIAGLLQIPYLLWILFASYLNLAIYLLNR